MPSENVAVSELYRAGAELDHRPASDRRGRKRAARREALLDHAGEIVAVAGVSGLTMAALAERADYAPASLYTYFASRSALISALQQRALTVLGGVARESADSWDDSLAQVGHGEPSEVSALARLWAFSDLFLTAPEHHPHEFALQQELLTTPAIDDLTEVASVVPVAMAVLDLPARLLRSARQVGVLNDSNTNVGDDVSSRLGEPLDVDLYRTITWVTALNGALLTDRIAAGLPTTGSDLGTSMTLAFLIGWGADRATVTKARHLADRHLVDSVVGFTRKKEIS